MLFGGQMHQVYIARALLVDALILVLTEDHVQY